MSQAFNRAVQLHRAGNLDQDELVYRQLLDDNPNHADVLHLLGVIAHQRGNPARAVALIRRAVAIDDTNPIYHCNLAESCRVSGDMPEAAAHSRKAIRLLPHHADAHNHLGLALQGHGNVTGADVVMRYTLSYPFGISMTRGYPRFNPGEYSTIDLLVRGDNDATIVIGADPGATMPKPAIEHLRRTPTIVLDPKVTHTSRLSRVHFTTAPAGISAPGTAYRMDEVPLPLRPALKSPYLSDEEVLKKIVAAVQRRPGWYPKAHSGTPVT